MKDLTFALRQLRKSPGFTLIAVLVLALVACFVPARRASLVDPIEALRIE